MEDARVTRESEVPPELPTSGQVLGFLVRSLGFDDPRLRSKTAQRYFSGRTDRLVKESSHSDVMEAISEALAELGLGATPSGKGKNACASLLASTLEWHAVNWDSMRTFLLPRMMRVYPRHLADVWRTYLRLATIDLALRVAGHLRLRGAPPEALDFLEWVTASRRGAYLNEKRKAARVTSADLAASVGVHEHTVEGWLYRSARPSDKNLKEISAALTSNDNPAERERLVRELRMLYWVNDIAGVLGKHIGKGAVEDMVGHLRGYTLLAHRTLCDSMTQAGLADAAELATQGAHSSLARPLLAVLASHESDGGWQEDLIAAGSGWVGRVLEVNLQVHRAEEDALIRETDGYILESWGVGNIAAYEHYRRSMELQMEGRMDAALAEVARAAALDPLDSVYHFILGSVRGGIGARNGDHVMVDQSLEECWVAVNLEPTWILPWTEIGWILLNTGRIGEAVEHLRGVRPGCEPLDARYYAALGTALRQAGVFAESLTAFESSLELNPNDMSVVAAAAGVASMAGDKLKSNHYRKVARHLGALDDLDRVFDLAKAVRPRALIAEIMGDHDRQIASLDAAIGRDPEAAANYLARGKAHFLNGDDGRAISDLDAAIRLDPANVAVHMLRGIVYGYMGRYDGVISDMSEAIRLSPGNGMAHYHRGLAHGEQGALNLAILDLNEALRLDSGHAGAYRGRGECHLRSGEYDLAIADFDAALRLDPEGARYYRGRGAALRMKGDLDGAIADYDTALRLDPEDPYAHRFRGDAYLAQHNWPRAIADFDAALRMNPADEVAYRGRGNAHLYGGELEVAVADFNSALGCDPYSAAAWYGRALARELMGDAEGSADDYRRARELGYDDSI